MRLSQLLRSTQRLGAAGGGEFVLSVVSMPALWRQLGHLRLHENEKARRNQV
jgi:hypothetical protein